MSRGLGKTQRLVLDVLAGMADEPPHARWTSVYEIAHRGRCDGTLEAVEGPDYFRWKCDECDAARPTPAESESVRRALRKLGDAGLAELMHGTWGTGREIEWVNRRTRWSQGTSRKQMYARLPLSVDEAEVERLQRDERDRRLSKSVAEARKALGS